MWQNRLLRDEVTGDESPEHVTNTYINMLRTSFFSAKINSGIKDGFMIEFNVKFTSDETSLMGSECGTEKG